jgi:molecular chaperone IbpA
MKSKLYTIDLSALPRFAVGFDELIEDLHRMAGSVTESNYPPYNIVKYSETEYAIEVAVAGFTEKELDIELVDNLLMVRGEHVDVQSANAEYLYRGIAARNFVRPFPLAENFLVASASVNNGVLTIKLQRNIPEVVKKKIAITFQK